MPHAITVPITARPAAIGTHRTNASTSTVRLISSMEGSAQRHGSSSTCVMAWNITMNSTFAPRSGIRASSSPVQIANQITRTLSGYRPMPQVAPNSSAYSSSTAVTTAAAGPGACLQANTMGTSTNSTGGIENASPPESFAARRTPRGVTGRAAASASVPRTQVSRSVACGVCMRVIVSAPGQPHGAAQAEDAQHTEPEGPGADHQQAGDRELPALQRPGAQLRDPVGGDRAPDLLHPVREHLQRHPQPAEDRHRHHGDHAAGHRGAALEHHAQHDADEDGGQQPEPEHRDGGHEGRGAHLDTGDDPHDADG